MSSAAFQVKDDPIMWDSLISANRLKYVAILNNAFVFSLQLLRFIIAGSARSLRAAAIFGKKSMR